MYLAGGRLDLALVEYESALKLQQGSLPIDHPDIARTLHNLAVVYVQRKDFVKAREYLERAEETAGRTLSNRHPVMTLVSKTKNFMVDDVKDDICSRL